MEAIVKIGTSISKIGFQGSQSFFAKLGIGINPGLKTIGRVLDEGAGHVRYFYNFLNSCLEAVTNSC